MQKPGGGETAPAEWKLGTGCQAQNDALLVPAWAITEIRTVKSEDSGASGTKSGAGRVVEGVVGSVLGLAGVALGFSAL